MVFPGLLVTQVTPDGQEIAEWTAGVLTGPREILVNMDILVQRVTKECLVAKAFAIPQHHK